MLHDVGEKRLWIGVFDAVGRRHGRQADAGLATTDGIHHSTRDFEREAGAVLDAAAIVVGALVAVGLQKLVEQIAVGAMDFDAVEASRFNGVACCGGK